MASKTNFLRARRHDTVVPADGSDQDPIPDALYCTAAGDVVVRDAFGNDETYTLAIGDILPVRAVRVLSTGTTGTVIGWLE